MTVLDLNKLTNIWLTAGHGSKSVLQWYDCNCACTGIGGKVKITDKTVEFLESGYPDRSEE